jgi:alkanesulfonate monooxygenase SsuD/methylene tetrahydromethanopterin reductase-like flavin-dependent oxidoreductase (luciferase family)
MIPLSVLDLVPVREGGSLTDAYEAAVAVAQVAERLGYRRYWVAEHHLMEGIGGAAASVVLARIGAATASIRIGSGGIMLPNCNGRYARTSIRRPRCSRRMWWNCAPC